LSVSEQRPAQVRSVQLHNWVHKLVRELLGCLDAQVSEVLSMLAP
jgi:hypothetical protein